MYAKFRRFHINKEIQGRKDEDGEEILDLKNLVQEYVKLTTLKALESNRETLYRELYSNTQAYIKETQQLKETRIIRLYIRRLFNLGYYFSQRIEFYYNVLKQMTNGQLSLKYFAIMLAQIVNRIIKDIESKKENDILFYSRLAQAPVFRDLRIAIVNKALGMIT